MAMSSKPFEVMLRGRESGQHHEYATLDEARDEADRLSKETGREARVYDTREGMLASPVYRTSEGGSL
jgi:hypothetical protein